MTIKFKPLVALTLIASAALIYSGCTKETKSTVLNTNNDKKIATSIANNLYRSISNLAGQNKSALPATNGVRNGKKITGLTCGEFIEVPYNNVYTKGDSVKDVMIGTDKYIVSCDANKAPNGYIYSGSYNNTGFSPYSVYDNSVKEYYILSALLPEFAKMKISGTQTSVYKFTTKKDGEYMEQNNSYVLKDLVIDATGRPFDIVSGDTDFASNGTNAGVAFNYHGSIKFLGGHKATLTLNGKTFDITID